MHARTRALKLLPRAHKTCAPLQARLKNPKTPQLWLAAVRTELRAQNQKAAEALQAKALQDCPDSGPLWAETINMVPRPQRKSRSGA